ncbi:hypothetical protein MPER_12910 [Moniliophthora perniciosa FA553]|nr:hypothetical protein MPER_12910 [Moniliophthora perniciosa FA553]
MEASSSSQQAKSVAQANVRQFLDLEAAVDRGGYDSEDDEVADGFINDNGDDEGRPVNYHALNRELEDDHNSLFSDDEILFSEPQDEPTGVDSVAAGQSGLALDQGTAGAQAIALGLDEDHPNVKRYSSKEVWAVKCKHYREWEVVRFIERYKKNRPEDNIFSSFQSGSCGSGLVYIQTRDSPRAASALRHCVYIRHSRTLGLNGVYMTVISDPIEIFTLSTSTSIAKVLNGHHDEVEIPQPVRDKPILKAGLWVRLGPIEKPKAKEENEAEASEPPRKKTRVDRPSPEHEEDVPMGDLAQTDSQASSLPTRSYSCEPDKPKPKTPLYFDDPAFVLGVDGDSVTTLFIPRIRASDLPETQLTKEEFPQRLVFNPLIQSQRPEDVKMAWDPSQYGRKRRRHAVYPDGGFEKGMRVQIVDKSMIKPLGRLPNSKEGRILLKCRHEALKDAFPPIEDWRFDIGDLVKVDEGRLGVVISHSPGGPIIQCDPDESDPFPQPACFGWKLIKHWLIGDYVRHVSGVEGFVIVVSDEYVVIQHPDNNVDHNFSGYPNSFRMTPREERSQGYSFRREPKAFHQTPWMEAAVRGPHELTTREDWQQFRLDWNEKLALR